MNKAGNHLQQRYLEAFTTRYNERTKKSKQLAQTYRPIITSNMGPVGFSLSCKEMCYPITAKRSLGSRIWDVDGNEYIDFMMGLGVNLFGHNPPFIQAALKEQLEKGIQIGPQSELTGEVGELICELTGMERVAFSNTGTEAVMAAIRLARTATGRNKIVLFSGSYHGHFDGTLVEVETIDGIPHTVPITSGIPQNIVEDYLVLDYGNPQSLDAIRANKHELAAVLVEPVQSRRPDLQPKDFLLQLRQLTKELGIALIFDEVITGFRVHPGGAQAWFGVEADIATYGKIVGGGMPIGIIAGKATYMDRIDGGMWNYGDASQPQVETTYFAGTFRRHPLAMAAALAVLKHLKMQGSQLQQQLNQRMSQLVETLNAYFEEEEVPLRLRNFSSWFSPAFLENFSLLEYATPSELRELLYYHLLDKGVMLGGPGGYLSTAHTDEDINYIIQAFKDSVRELRKGGFLPPIAPQNLVKEFSLETREQIADVR
ncbi:aspartate aminotransferase family protein [Nostoc punctiforme]|uniref:Aminotransferase class-III n=1 Tax=Nostoc punctiforme (strain ATCC 29133 / PCC 73102) TaxID=63737 RepID=B2J104_NOSP7|nr:aspartate aminotransferase family protein [Nostoc punctiforme]ACC81855.1 aminotransferase class-III [Nostoc punctiforme PCC 73102]